MTIMRGGSRTGTLVTWMVGVILSIAVVAAPAWADDRVALVVGNATYEHAPALPTSLNDAADVGAALQRIGFAVTRIDDADQGELRRGLHEFAMAAGAAETALVYYAGHAIASGGRNFLVPVDARLSSSQDIEFETVPLELAERAMSRASDVRLIILDASRQSPFAASMTPDEGTEPVTPGLARVDPSAGTLVAFAAKEGTVALESEGRNSRYSEALLRHLEEPGLALEQMLSKLREAVLALTGGTEEPTVYGSLLVESAYLGPQPAPSGEAQTTGTPTTEAAADNQLTAEKLAAERLFWESVEDSGDPAEIQTYLDQYPSGTFAALARARLKRLGGTASPVSPHGGSVSDAGTPDEATADTPPEPAEQHTALEPEATEAALGLQRDHRRLIQSGLALLGFDPGPADGVFGQRTRTAIKDWQNSVSKVATGYLDVEAAKTLARRGIEASRKGTEAPSTSEQQERSKQAAMDILARALQTAKEVDDLYFHRSRVIAEIGRVLWRAGDIGRATSTFELALHAAQEHEYPGLHVSHLLEVAAVQRAAGDAGGAAKSLELAFAAANQASEVFQDRNYSEIAISQAEAGDVTGAFATLRSIVSQEIRDEALHFIAQFQAATGDAQGALATAGQIVDESWRSQLPSTVAEAQEDREFYGLLAFPLEGEYIMINGLEDKERFNSAVRQGAAGDVQAALATAERIEHVSVRAVALAKIAAIGLGADYDLEVL